MMKWKSSNQKSTLGFLQKRKSIELRTHVTKKYSNERPSYKGYLNRRAITEPEEPAQQNRSSFLPNRNSYANCLQKSKTNEKAEITKQYLVCKRNQKISRPGYLNSQQNCLNSHNRCSYNEFSFNEQEWQSKIHGSVIPSTNTEVKWKKTRIKQEQTYNKLKQIHNFLKTKRQDEMVDICTKRNHNFEDAQDEQDLVKRESEMKGERKEKQRIKTMGDQDEMVEKRYSNLHINISQLKNKKSERDIIKFYPRKSKNIGHSSRNSAGMKIKSNENPGSQKQEVIDKQRLMTMNKIGAGTFGQVYTVKDTGSGKLYAVKKIYNDKSHKNRQIEIMEAVESKFVIKKLINYSTFNEVEGEEKEYIFIVMPKYESNLYEYFRNSYYAMSEDLFKIYLFQIFRGVLHLHSRGICHRDLKPQNILLKNNRLVICDLGSAKILSPDEQNISYICSRCYRAPQLIFGNTKYTVSVDIWSVGCIILEFLNKGPLFVGKDSLHHLVEIIKVLGTPTKTQILSMNPKYDSQNFKMPKIKMKRWSTVFPNINRDLEDLLEKIMIYSPAKRITAGEVFFHPYFSDIREEDFMKRVSIKHALDTTDFFSFDPRQREMIKEDEKLLPSWSFDHKNF